MDLVTCPGCARHVRADERSCPFCHGDKPRVGPRGLVVAAIVGASLALAGCPKREQAALYGGPPEPEPSEVTPGAGGGDSQGDEGNGGADSAGGEGGGASVEPAPPVKALYGAPPPRTPESPRQ